ncbi:helix-turn-helix transcriptional regulator [Clostridium tertium]|nr:helix-turn-helix transcriptional regulator [Clostridium tertium]
MKKKKKENIPIPTKQNDLIMWNVVFAREVIKNGSTKTYLHTLYNKYYNAIINTKKLHSLQQLELDMINSYFDILINHVELRSNLILNKIIGYLYINLENTLTLERIASELDLSVGYLSNTFKKNMGISIMKYFKELKIERAKVLLLTTNKSILEISTSLYFCDQGNFCKTFKNIVGFTPSQFRNNNIQV